MKDFFVNLRANPRGTIRGAVRFFLWRFERIHYAVHRKYHTWKWDGEEHQWGKHRGYEFLLWITQWLENLSSRIWPEGRFPYFTSLEMYVKLSIEEYEDWNF